MKTYFILMDLRGEIFTAKETDYGLLLEDGSGFLYLYENWNTENMKRKMVYLDQFEEIK